MTTASAMLSVFLIALGATTNQHFETLIDPNAKRIRKTDFKALQANQLKWILELQTGIQGSGVAKPRHVSPVPHLLFVKGSFRHQ